MKDRYDAVIVGAGPAGSGLAIRLARGGMSVALIEKMRFPRHKLCGEFISPECLSHFVALGVMPAIIRTEGPQIDKTVFYARSGRSVTVETDRFGKAGSAIGISRSALDELLLRRAGDLGVTVFEGVTASGLMTDNDKVIKGVNVKTPIGTTEVLGSNIAVDATGRSRSLVRFATPKNRSAKPKHVAFKAHFENADIEPGVCEIYGYAGGYGGCNRVEGDRFNLCFIASALDARDAGGDGDLVMRKSVFANRRAAQTMNSAKRISEWIAVPIDQFGRHELVPAKGLISIGDAAAFIDPFTGSGILMAMQSSEIAANAMMSGADMSFDVLAEKYQSEYSRVFGRRLRVCSVLRHAAFVPMLADATVACLSASKILTRSVAALTRSGSSGQKV